MPAACVCEAAGQMDFMVLTTGLSSAEASGRSRDRHAAIAEQLLPITLLSGHCLPAGGLCSAVK